MFRLILCLSLIAPLPACAGAVAIVAMLTQDNGTVPPPYREEFRAEFRADGTVRLTACRGYDEAGCVQRVARVEPEVIEALMKAGAASRLERRPAALNPEPPIGGGLTYGWVKGETGRIELPAFPAKRDRRRVEKVLAALRAAVPDTERAAVNAEADTLIKEE